MAPARTVAPRTKRGPQNLTNIGVEGRATGLTVDERPRDENGLEVLESWYSSPAPLENRTGTKSHGMSNSSEDMEVAQSSGPEPTEVMNSGRLAHSRGKSAVPLPRARSPIKTSLGATPLRGTPRSSMSTAKTQIVESAPPKSPRRLLNFSTNEVTPSVDRSGSRKSATRISRNAPSSANGRIFDLPRSPEPNQSQMDDFDGDADETQVFGEMDIQDESPPRPGDAEEALDQREDEQQLMEEAEAAAEATEEIVDGEVFNEPEAEEREERSAVDETMNDAPPPKPRGRPRKHPLAEKDANQKLKPQTQSRSTKESQKRPPPQSRPAAQRRRAQTPMEEDGTVQTRSGRSSYRPLAYWKGERAVFEEHTRNEELREIIRVEDATPQKRPRSAPSGRTKRKKRNHTIFEEEQDQDYEEAWEISEGVISAPVKMWDSELGVAPVDHEVDQQLAFASARIQPRASPDNPNFFFTKTLTMPFFGSGVIEIPAGGYKGSKNSRKFQFIFFVHYGKVNVEVAGTPFTISKGGMWQVPRGNFYRIDNDTDHPAKIFFAQSCEVVMEMDPPAPPPLL